MAMFCLLAVHLQICFIFQVGVDGGSGYFPGIQAGDLVTESQRATAAGFGGDEAMIELGWWEELCD